MLVAVSGRPIRALTLLSERDTSSCDHCSEKGVTVSKAAPPIIPSIPSFFMIGLPDDIAMGGGDGGLGGSGRRPRSSHHSSHHSKERSSPARRWRRENQEPSSLLVCHRHRGRRGAASERRSAARVSRRDASRGSCSSAIARVGKGPSM